MAFKRSLLTSVSSLSGWCLNDSTIDVLVMVMNTSPNSVRVPRFASVELRAQEGRDIGDEPLSEAAGHERGY